MAYHAHAFFTKVILPHAKLMLISFKLMSVKYYWATKSSLLVQNNVTIPEPIASAHHTSYLSQFCTQCVIHIHIFLSQIYAILSINFSDIKIRWCEKYFNYDLWFISHVFSLVNCFLLPAVNKSIAIRYVL